jgi:hypothetical protein
MMVMMKIVMMMVVVTMTCGNSDSGDDGDVGDSNGFNVDVHCLCLTKLYEIQ